MNNNQILDSILHSYLFGQKMKLENDPRYLKMTFDFIFNTQTKREETESWQMEFLKQTLLNDGFIKLPESGIEPYELTPTGIKAAQVGWYKKNERDVETEKQLNLLTVADLKRSKATLAIAILALIIPTALSIYSIIQSAKTDKDKEIEKLRIELIEIKKEITDVKKRFSFKTN
ncbi:hypothetical protein [Sphingobacterium sp. JUb56]|uniref:hypothetical protein n=1 Tax=Sphingobacterium sp. JUb56 TaxID=2587145 RepID=UPI00161DB4DC|nr:hypothetical protein [Sphingobacterium sp. JUb56]MBB2950753.1 hypothetical protein [Sphingobacterium sp. JUb56]